MARQMYATRKLCALHQSIEAGLLREVVVNSGHSYFDTNVSDHFRHQRQ
jgi:hypothetical protein